jgi:hypothetical protein
MVLKMSKQCSCGLTRIVQIEPWRDSEPTSVYMPTQSLWDEQEEGKTLKGIYMIVIFCPICGEKP